MKSRDESQNEFIDRWIANNFSGFLVAITGWGKTYCAIKAAIQSKAESIVVIVPTKELRRQWTIELYRHKVKNATIYVVNTAIKKGIDCDLLIIDEAHSTGCADWFSLSWKQAKFNKIIALSATHERKDKKHMELLKIAPILMQVTFKEALDNNWVSNYTIYNLGLSLTNAERIHYNNIENTLEDIFNEVAELTNSLPSYIRSNMFNLARKFMSNTDRNNGKRLLVLGIMYNKLINKRKTLLYNAQAKKDKTIWFLKESKLNKKQTIIFSQTQDFANYIYENFQEETEVIHSGMKDKERELALKRFNDKRTKKRILSTVKALNQGIDVPTLEFGIIASGTSSKIDIIQQIGRVIRLSGSNEAIIVNLYMKNTQDAIWTRNKLFDFDKSKIKWIN